MTAFIAAAFVFVCLWSVANTKFGRKVSSAPALLLIAGAGASLFYRAFGLPAAPVEWVADAAEAGLGALAFVSAAQLRISRLSQSPAALRLTLGGAPLFLAICALAAFILLPQLNFASALLLGAALMLNGAAFDRRAVINAPAPREIKAAVRLESAAIVALGAPVALLLAANATAAAVSEPAAGPLMETSLEVLKGFAFGGLAGLLVAKSATRKRKTGRAPRFEGQILALVAIAAFAIAGVSGADPIVAALAVGLIWGEETSAPAATRRGLRRLVEQAAAPAAYFTFGCLFAPRVLQADLLPVLFALAAVTVLRAGPRLAVLQDKKTPRENQVFLAWFGGAPGAASALFLIVLLDNPALTNQDGVLTVGALAVSAGVLAARLTSKPLANAYLRERAIAARRRLYF